VVVVEVPVVGRSDEQAAIAVLYFGFEVIDEFADGALPAVFVGIVTPCKVMQLRNAASCVELAPEPPPPPKPEPAGRKLAQAWNAARDFEFPPPKPPAGGPPVDDPEGLLPLPKPEPVTPCCLRHVVNAVLDDVDFVGVAGFVVVVFLVDVEDADVAAPPPHAASTTPARAKASTTAGTVRCLPRRLSESVRFVMGTVWKAKLDER
jgi:hypothetical protein